MQTMRLDMWAVLTGPEQRAVRLMLWLAFFNQAVGSTAIINYGPTVLQDAGVKSKSDSVILTVAVTACKVGPRFTYFC